MALENNVELVVRIDERTYEDIKNGKAYSSMRDVPQESVLAIANGTPLEKGHGKIIDADAVITEAKEKMRYPSNHKYMECVIATMILAPPVIPITKADVVIDADLVPKEHKEETQKRLTNKEWIDFLSEQFDVSRTSARDMLHAMMSVKKEDNFKKQFNKPAKTEEMDEAIQEEEEER